MSRIVLLEIKSDEFTVDVDSVQAGPQSEGKISVMFMQLVAKSPVDQRTGSPKGNREYSGIRIRKRLDRASIGLIEAFTKRLPMQAKFEIQEVNLQAADEQQVALIVSIGGGDPKNAFISSYTLTVPDIESGSANDPQEPWEELLFTFDQIQFEKAGRSGYLNSQASTIIGDSLTGVHNA